MMHLWQRATTILVSWRAFFVLIVASLALVGLIFGVHSGGWSGLLGDIAINVTSSGLTAVAVLGGALLEVRRRVRSRLMNAQLGGLAEHEPPSSASEWVDNWSGLASAIATDIASHRRIQTVTLIEMPTGAGRTSLVSALTIALAHLGVLALPLDGEELGDLNDLNEPARQRLEGLSRRARVPDSLIGPAWRWAAGHGRACVLVEGIDTTISLANLTERREVVARRLLSIHSTTMSVVALVEPGCVPDPFDGRVVELPAPHHSAVRESVRAAGLSNSAESAASALLVKLVDSLQHSDVSPGLLTIGLRTRLQLSPPHPNNAVVAATLDSLIDEIREGHTVCLAHDTLASVGAFDRIEQQLSPLLAYMVLHETDSVPVGVVHGLGNPDATLGLYAAISRLTSCGILRRRRRTGSVYLMFTDRSMLEVLVGRWIAAHDDVTVTGGLGRFSSAAQAAFVGATSPGTHARAGKHPSLLDLATTECLVRHLRSSTPPSSPAELELLWVSASDAERVHALRYLSARLHPEMMQFLWHQSLRPADTSRTVRVEIARWLARAGASSLRALGDDWRDLVDALEGGGLSWRDRDSARWEQYGSPAALLVWILPTLACYSVDDQSSELFHRVVEAVVPAGALEDDWRVDIGIEISLAEGLKLAALESYAGRLAPSHCVWNTSKLIVETGTSWLSRLLAFQAMALHAGGDVALKGDVTSLGEHLLGGGRLHPLMAQQLEVIVQAMSADGHCDELARIVWRDDTATLASAGEPLAAESLATLTILSLLLNLTEARFRLVSGSNAQAHEARVRLLTANELPPCLTSRRCARKAYESECSCHFRLCGPDARTVQIRPLGRIFANRALAVLASGSNSGLGKAERTAIQSHLKAWLAGCGDR